MNTTSAHDDALPAGERFIDAALSEHARLGSRGTDTELIHRILLETVHRRPAPIAKPPVRSTYYWGIRLAGAAAIAALLILAGISLSPIGKGDRDRPTEELQFTVHFLDTAPVPERASVATTPPQLAGKAYSDSVPIATASIAATEAPALATGSYELITTLGPSFEVLPARGTRRENFRITADRSLISANRRLYEGSVLVEHTLFSIEASEVSVPAPGRAESSDASPLLASNVTVTQQSPYRVAHAKSLRFDPFSGAIVLSGVESFETDGGTLGRFAPGDKLVLNGEGFSVESPDEVR
jgi:hypothetical protein